MISRATLNLNCTLYGSETHVLFIQDLLGRERLLEEQLGSGSGVNSLEMVCLTSKQARGAGLTCLNTTGKQKFTMTLATWGLEAQPFLESTCITEKSHK